MWWCGSNEYALNTCTYGTPSNLHVPVNGCTDCERRQQVLILRLATRIACRRYSACYSGWWWCWWQKCCCCWQKALPLPLMVVAVTILMLEDDDDEAFNLTNSVDISQPCERHFIHSSVAQSSLNFRWKMLFPGKKWCFCLPMGLPRNCCPHWHELRTIGKSVFWRVK